MPTSTITAERMTGEDSFSSTAAPASAMAEVSRSLAISEAAGRDILGALDTLERIARGRGQKLSPRVAVIRRDLASCLSRACTRAGRSDDAFADPLGAESAMTDTTTAAAELGITRDGVAWLCRNGNLRATRVGGRWLVDGPSLAEYRRRRRAGLTERSPHVPRNVPRNRIKH